MLTQPWINLKKAIEKGNAKRLVSLIEKISVSERARAFSRLDPETIRAMFLLLPSEYAGDLLEELPDEQAADLVELLPSRDAFEIVDSLSTTDQADILADMEDDKAEAILGEMSSEDAQKAREILQYPEDSAGGLMQTDYISFPEDSTIGEVLDDLQGNASTYSDFQTQYIYLTTLDGSLAGVIRLRDLIFSPRITRVRDLKIKDPLSVPVDMILDDMVQIFEDHKFLGLPVVDGAQKLVGVVRRKNILEAYDDKNTDTYLKASGIVGGEELRSMPLRERSKRRLSWLSINIILNIIAASVIAFFQETLSEVIALAVFLPIISDMSGCSGNQAVAVSIRELTLGLVKPHELGRVLLKELGVGLINGLILGLLLGAAAWLWKGNVLFGLVVGGALAVNTIVAVSLGGLIPLFLQRSGKDPALASGPILTTVTDMCGFLLALGFATMSLSYLN